VNAEERYRNEAHILTCERDEAVAKAKRLREALEDIADHKVGEVIEHAEAYARATLEEDAKPEWCLTHDAPMDSAHALAYGTPCKSDKEAAR